MGDHIATYREIAVHFGLSGPNAARTKVKRARWTVEPTNHPGDPLRIRVPRDAWEIPDLKLRESRGISDQKTSSHKSHLKTLEMALELLRDQLTRERQRADAMVIQADAARGQIEEYAREISVLRGQLQAERGRADLAEQGRNHADTTLAAVRADLDRERANWADQRDNAGRLEAENQNLQLTAKATEQVLREAEATLRAERAAKVAIEAQAAAADQAHIDAQEAARSVEAERSRADWLQTALDQARANAAEAVQAAKALRPVEVARAAEAARNAPDRSAMVVSKIDEVQLRRLQKEEQDRKSLGRWKRLRRAWRGD